MSINDDANPGKQDGQNTLDLNQLAARIHKRARKHDAYIADCEDLYEARVQCKSGKWLDWLRKSDFDEWSEDTAERGVKVGWLVSRFRKLRNLKLKRGPFCWLADYAKKSPDEMPAIEAELVKHAAKKPLSRSEAERVINIAISRHHFGSKYPDVPDSVLLGLLHLDKHKGESWYNQLVSELLRIAPDNDEATKAIIREGIKVAVSGAKANGSQPATAAEPATPAEPSTPAQVTTPANSSSADNHAEDDDDDEPLWCLELLSLIDDLRALHEDSIADKTKTYSDLRKSFTPGRLRETADLLRGTADLLMAAADNDQSAA